LGWNSETSLKEDMQSFYNKKGWKEKEGVLGDS